MRRGKIYAVSALLMCAILYPLPSNAIEQTASPDRNAESERQEPEKISSVGGKKLNPNGVIPSSGFRAFYFDRRLPDQVIFEENVDDIAIKYAWAEFHGIDSKNFGGYWIGKLNFPTPARKQISISQSWAKSRILVDGEIIFTGDSNRVVHDFSAGEHIIEVEYINNWHTTEYKVTIEDEIVPYTISEVKNYFRSKDDNSEKLYYVSLYESKSKDTSVRVSIPETEDPIILWLSSYEAIDWYINTSSKISDVIIGSNRPGSRVRGAGVDRVIHLNDWDGITHETSQCSCTSGYFHCEQKEDINDLATKLQSITLRKLSGYALAYSADNVAMQPLDGNTKSRVERTKQQQLDAERQCKAYTNPDFDRLTK